MQDSSVLNSSSQKIVIVGAGISGATIAQRFATELNKKVLVIDKRDHIGGNCYDYYNENGILVSKYGAHLFHTNYDDVWRYVQKFSEFTPYVHRVLASVGDKLVPIPVNITTVNELLSENIKNEVEMDVWLMKNQIHNPHPANGKEAAEARVGKVLYEKLFKNYTKKQWDKYPEALDPEVLQRIPVRNNFDDRYFSDVHQGQPQEGYTKLFENMLKHPNITVQLNTDYFEVKDQLSYEKLFYTGPIDQFFNYKYSQDRKLEYRSLKFEFETFDREYYQENSVINYPNEHAYTRIVEYKYFTGQKSPKTTISKEFSTDYIPGVNEPYYPVPNPENRKVYELYQKEAEKLEKDGIYFVGRLANYKYFNMDQAFKNALDLFYRLYPEAKPTQ